MKKLFSAFALAALTLSACSAQTHDVSESTFVEEAEQLASNELFHQNKGDLLGYIYLEGSEEAIGSIFLATGEHTFLSGNAQLPILEEGFFYEGWLLRDEPLSVVSTGAFTFEEYAEGVYDFDNEIELEGDYSDHLKYIITLEPYDGDPAPAEHVAEATLTTL